MVKTWALGALPLCQGAAKSGVKGVLHCLNKQKVAL